MDPREILNRGRTLADQGKYSEALTDYLWFHEHALEHDRSYYGVRLSFALGYWHDLASVYSPALIALEATARNDKQKLLAGNGDCDLFNDVKAINRELGRPEDTYQLYLDLRRLHPELAQRCGRRAIEEVVLARDFTLAAELLPKPETYLLQISDQLNENVEAEAPSPSVIRRMHEAYVQIYCKDVRLALMVLAGLGNRSAARSAKIWAVALIRRKRFRSMVCDELTRRRSAASASW